MHRDQSDAGWVTLEGTKAHLLESIGLGGERIFEEAHETFRANAAKHLENRPDADFKMIADLAIADVYLAGIFRGRELGLSQVMAGSRS